MLAILFANLLWGVVERFVVWYVFTTVFVVTQLWKTKHPRKRFQNFRQSCLFLTDRSEIHQLQPLVWPSNLLYVMLLGCDWWILTRFRGCFVIKSRVWTKTMVKFIIISLVFFYRSKPLFSGFLQFKGNFERGQNNSKYLDWIPLRTTYRQSIRRIPPSWTYVYASPMV